jgi:hypothetical protein
MMKILGPPVRVLKDMEFSGRRRVSISISSSTCLVFGYVADELLGGNTGNDEKIVRLAFFSYS